MSSEYVIWSFKHGQWWRPNHAGYTPHLLGAGLYSAEEAGAIVTSSIMGESAALLLQVAEQFGAPTVKGLWAE